MSHAERSKSLSRTLTAFVAAAALLCNGLPLGAQQQSSVAAEQHREVDPENMSRLPTWGPVVSEKGMVATAHPLASEAGLRILREGGNAFDAAVAVAVAIGVVMSDQTDGISGEGFGLFYIAKTHEVKALEWGSRVPDNPEFTKRVKEIEQQDNPVNLIAPGALAGMDAIIKTLGTKTLAQVLQPSIEYCEQGIPVRPSMQRAIEHRAKVFSQDPHAAAIFLPDGKVPPVGYSVKMVDEARSLHLIADEGKDALYKGELDKEILAWSKQVGGLITQKDMDFASNPRWVTPMTSTYHGNTIYAVPPAAGGIPLLEMMNILEGYNLKGMSEPERTHVLEETIRISLNDMETYFGDPARTKARLDEVLSKQYAAQMRSEIKPDKVIPWKLVPGDTVGGGTTHFDVVDAEGNVASITNTRSSWGIARPAGNTGIFLHAGTRLLSDNPNNPMFATPGKLLQKSITPVLVFDSQNKLILTTGAAGGRTITHTNAEVLINVLDLGMNIQQALTAPRISYEGAGEKLNVSYGFQPETIEMLHKLGYDFKFMEEGVAQGISIDPTTNARIGGSDPRSSGSVVAY